MSAQNLWLRIWPKHLWVLFFVVISPAAFLIPNDVFSQYPWTRTYAEWLAKGIPMIDRAAHLHPHPEKFKAFFAYAWSWLPFGLAWALTQRQPLLEGLKGMQKEPSFGLIFIALLTAFSIWVVVVAPGQSLFDLGPISRTETRARFYFSNFSLAWSAPFQVIGIACCMLTFGGILNMARNDIYAIKTPGRE